MRIRNLLLATAFFAAGAASATMLEVSTSGVAFAAQKNLDPALAVAALQSRIAALEADVAKLKSAISVGNGGNVTINANKVKVNASQFEVSSAMAKFGGVIKGGVIDVDSVVAKSYTPGAGNVW